LSRSSRLIKILEKNRKGLSYADIGAGDRFFTSKLKSITNEQLFAVDTEYGESASIEDGIVCLNDIAKLENNSMDCIIMMDVLEHIENDHDFLKLVLEKLKPQGMVLITVPALQSLYSSHDNFLRHYRRYNHKNLRNLLQNNGVTIEKMHYFYSVLLFPRMLTVLKEKVFPVNKSTNKGIGQWKYAEKAFSTRFISYLLNVDFSINQYLNKWHLIMPGLSLMAICKKNE
jgi:SAM-dependent methyltransferase